MVISRKNTSLLAEGIKRKPQGAVFMATLEISFHVSWTP